MMKPHLLSILALLALGINLMSNTITQTKEYLAHTDRQGIRAFWIYFVKGAPTYLTRLAELADSRFNMLVIGNRMSQGIQDYSLQPDGSYFREINPQQVGYLRQCIRAAKRNRMAAMVMICDYNEEFRDIIRGKTYRHLVDLYGVADSLMACPGDRGFLRGAELPRIRLVARLLEEEQAVGGFIYETEAYLASPHYPGFSSQKTEFCYCEDCFKSFLQERGLRCAVPPATERYAFLSRRALTGEYSLFMNRRYASMYRFLHEEVAKIKPDLLPAMYQASMNEHSVGFAMGTGTADIPALLFSSSEYFVGVNRPSYGFASNGSTRDFQAYLGQFDCHARILPGLLQGSYYARQYASEVAYALQQTAGFWLYDGSTLLKDYALTRTTNPHNMSEYALKSSPEDFLRYLKAIDEPRQFASAAKERKSPLDLKLQNIEAESFNAERKQFSFQALSDAPDAQSQALPIRFDARQASQWNLRYVRGHYQGESEACYGFSADVVNLSSSQAATVSLGSSWPGLYPAFFDCNYVLPPRAQRTLKLVARKQPKGLQHVRFGKRAVGGAVELRSASLQRLSLLTLRSEPLRLPRANSLRLGFDVAPSVFQATFTVHDAETGEPLMKDCSADTDLSQISRLFPTRAVTIAFHIYATAPVAGSDRLIHNVMFRH